MLSKLRLDGSQAEINALDKLIQQETTYGDLIAEYQLTKRKQILQDEMAQLNEMPERTASVALFFGGKPVMGSRGIAAEQSSNLAASGDFVIRKKCKIKIQRRIVRPLNRPPREVVRLLEFAGS